MSAPARLMPVRSSRTIRFSSIQPFCGGGLDHRVFAARRCRRRAGTSKRVLDPADDVEVGEGRLDHDHVSAFGEVEGDLAEGLVAVGGVHLVAAAVAELRGALGGVAEGPVEGAGVLGGVGQDRESASKPSSSRPVRMAATMPSIMPEGAITSAPAWAWLTAWRAEVVRAWRRCRRRCGRRTSRERAAVAVVGVLAEADVGDDEQVGGLVRG